MLIVEPVRVERSYVQKLRGKPGSVFPLLCPVREAEWAEGWDPLTVYTRSGFAESDCVFTTGEKDPDSIWVITDFDRKHHRLEIVKVTPGMTVGRIRIALSENGAGDTDAAVSYMYTAISPDGEEFVRAYSEEFFKRFMQYSEAALNDFLRKKPENGDGL
ncbi:MAG: hypothetical protein WAW37_04605 [Syntrophobacteraceae bacterium]